MIPIAAGLKDSDLIREKYFKIIMKRLESYCNVDIKKHIEYKKVTASMILLRITMHLKEMHMDWQIH